MAYDDIRAPLVALLSQPTALASVVLIASVHAATWRLVFERVGFPRSIAPLLLVPPLSILLPLYVALARWPSQRLVRISARKPHARGRLLRPAVRRQAPIDLGPDTFHGRPLRLDATGLPRIRIPLYDSGR